MQRPLSRILAATGLGVLLTTAGALAATDTILLEINGTQGNIQGENRSPNGSPDMIECFDYHHLIHVHVSRVK